MLPSAVIDDEFRHNIVKLVSLRGRRPKEEGKGIRKDKRLMHEKIGRARKRIALILTFLPFYDLPRRLRVVCGSTQLNAITSWICSLLCQNILTTNGKTKREK